MTSNATDDDNNQQQKEKDDKDQRQFFLRHNDSSWNDNGGSGDERSAGGGDGDEEASNGGYNDTNFSDEAGSDSENSRNNDRGSTTKAKSSTNQPVEKEGKKETTKNSDGKPETKKQEQSSNDEGTQPRDNVTKKKPPKKRGITEAGLVDGDTSTEADKKDAATTKGRKSQSTGKASGKGHDGEVDTEAQIAAKRAYGRISAAKYRKRHRDAAQELQDKVMKLIADTKRLRQENNDLISKVQDLSKTNQTLLSGPNRITLPMAPSASNCTSGTWPTNAGAPQPPNVAPFAMSNTNPKSLDTSRPSVPSAPNVPSTQETIPQALAIALVKHILENQNQTQPAQPAGLPTISTSSNQYPASQSSDPASLAVLSLLGSLTGNRTFPTPAVASTERQASIFPPPPNASAPTISSTTNDPFNNMSPERAALILQILQQLANRPPSR